MKYAPVLITTLCRFDHFVRLIRSLKGNGWAKNTDVYVAVDFPPSNKYRKGWEDICSFLDKDDFSAFLSFNVIKRDRNYGFENNADDLLSRVYDKYDRFIVLEDDLELSPNYLEYIDKCLEVFENDDDVVAVTGYSYPVDWKVSDGATLFKQNFNAAAWGRAFWKEKRTKYLEYISSRSMLNAIDIVISQKKYQKMIDASLREYIPAALCPIKRLHKFMYFPCDISMRAYLAVTDKYIISPVLSKVRNYGFDGSGVYCQNIDTNTNGYTSGTYNYSQQPIDNKKTFDFIPSNNDSMIESNRNMLNIFDKRTLKQMCRTKFLLWVVRTFGVQTGKFCTLLMLPYDISIRLLKKIV